MSDKFNLDDDGSGGGDWMNTYADLVTLLLCLFILLYSMSIVDQDKFKKAAGSLNQMGIFGESGDMQSNVSDTISDFNSYEPIIVTSEMDSIYKEVVELVKSGGFSESVDVERLESGVLLRFKDNFLFDVGRAELKPNVKTNLNKIGDILRKYNKNIRVEGFTDNVPIHNSDFRSNWELSTARAISVVRYYTEELPKGKNFNPEIFEVTGYGEYHPLAPNNSEANRQKNRRIEITIKE